MWTLYRHQVCSRDQSDIFIFFFFSSRRRHTRCSRDWSSDVCSSDLTQTGAVYRLRGKGLPRVGEGGRGDLHVRVHVWTPVKLTATPDRKSTRLNSSHGYISYAVFCLKKKKAARQRDRAVESSTQQVQ